MEQRSGNFVLGPEQLALLREAFDAAWVEIAQHVGSSPTSTEVTRLRLANAVLAAYRHGTTELAAIKAAALRSLLMWHPELLPSVTEVNGGVVSEPATTKAVAARPS